MGDGPRIGSLFSGYAGLCHLGLAPLVGGTVTWCSEYEPPSKNNPKPSQAPARILAHHYPDTKNLGDITAIDWATVEPVNWLTGGFPCTDVSVAGAQAGMVAGTRSGLWSEFARAIAALRPEYVFIENVGGLRSARADSDVEPCAWCLGDRPDQPHVRALGAVLGDLAGLGFDAEWVSVRASDIGAPHRRERVFVLARNRGRLRDTDGMAGSAPGAQCWGSDHLVGSPTVQRTLRPGGGHVPDVEVDEGRFDHGDRVCTGGSERRHGSTPRSDPAADTDGVGRGEGWTEPEGRIGGPEVEFGGRCPTCGCTAPHPDLTGPQGHRGPVRDADQLDPAAGGAGPVPDPVSGGRDRRPQSPRRGERGRTAPSRDSGPDIGGTTLPHPDGGRRGGGGLPTEPDPQHGQPGDTGHPVVDWGIYGPAITRWERTIGRPAPAPTELSKKGSPVLSAAFTEFLMGLPAGHVTSVPGIGRADQLKALGNGVVPLQAQLALNMLLPLLDDH